MKISNFKETKRETRMKFEEEFKIRTYTKIELACLYNPDMAISGALRTLSRWISGSNRLTEELCLLEYKSRNRVFTPLQVKTIVEHLGEP
jgi:hypothetical protein